ncbi:MAG: hypothetical protein GF344_06180, partial [Chitinivibrionales bacterium]|nr:hypothetical protein [Chitinivibrionales bacterium]
MKTLIFIMLIITLSFAANKKIVYRTAYGREFGMVSYELRDYPDECTAVSSTFFIVGSYLYLQDGNGRVLKIVLNDRRIADTLPNVHLKYVNIEESYIIAYKSIERIQGCKSFTIFQSKGKSESFRNFVLHPSGFLILVTNRSTYYFDSTLTLITQSNLPDYIKVKKAFVFLDEEALITFGIDEMRNAVSIWSHKLWGNRTMPQTADLFPFPDSTEWGPYFKDRRPSVSIKYLGYDIQYNTYWSARRKEPRDTANSYQAIFSYNRFGELRYWFPEPLLEPGWKHHCDGDIVISKEGRIFQMAFYSKYEDFLNRKKKECIDTTKGIRILEYIPEKKDFTHECRVELYGSKSLEDLQKEARARAET